MSPARGPRRWLFAAAAIIGFAGATGAAGADEPADRGISLAAWAGGALDRSVVTAQGEPVDLEALVAGLSGVGNIERVAMGGAVDVRPGVAGEGRLSISALLGYQQQIGHDRVIVLGEGGSRRFSGVGTDVLAHQLGPDPWLPFVGVRVGTARTVPPHGFFELGTWLFARYDLRRATVTSLESPAGDARTEYRVGGFMAGLAVEVGLRLESPHPWNQGVVEW
jgi:hypothetical protein